MDNQYYSKPPADCNLLVIDDEKLLCDLLKESLQDKYKVETSYCAADAAQLIKEKDFDVIVTDLKLPDGSGMDILKLAKKKDKFCEVIIITGYGTLESASESINLGVTSYLNKPLAIHDFAMQVEKAVASRLFHLRSINLINHTVYDTIPDVKEHIVDITSLYYFSGKLMLSLDVSEVMRIILEEINEKFDLVYALIGVNYLNFSEVFAMPSFGSLTTTDVVNTILSSWDTSFEVFSKTDFSTGQIPVYLFSGQKENVAPVDNSTFSNVSCLPMTILGETIGFIVLYRKEKEALTKERHQFFYVFTTLISSAIQHCYMDLLAKQQAKTDSLTGVANHRMFHETLEREIARSDRNKKTFCLAMIDIDNFKKINDSYGHLVGDAVLVDVTKRILKTIRRGDVLSRYGGEEFTVILPETDNSGGEKLANRICKIIGDTPYVFPTGKLTYTVSIGLSKYDPVDSTCEKDLLISKADNALYVAKRNGKNRVVISQ